MYKKPAFWIALVLCLAAIITAVCVFLKPADKDLPPEGDFGVSQLMCADAQIDSVEDETNAPAYHLAEGKLYWNRTAEGEKTEQWNLIGDVSDVELTEKNFDAYFPDTALWQPEDTTPVGLRAENRAAWYAEKTEEGQSLFFYLLEQNDGAVILCRGFRQGEEGTIRWVQKLEQGALPAKPTTKPTTEDAEPTEKETVPETTEVPEVLNGEMPERPAPQPVLALPQQYTAETLVTAGWKGKLTWEDLAGNNCAVSMSIPHIYPFSEDAVKVEAQIFDDIFPFVEENYESYQDKTSAIWISLDWKAYLNQDVLSIVVQLDTDHDWTDYRVYNLDLKTGEQLDDVALAAKLGMDKTAYLEKAAACADREFVERFGQDQDSEFYQQQREENKSADNLEDARLFLGEKGEPMLMFPLISMVGAHDYPTIVPLEK